MTAWPSALIDGFLRFREHRFTAQDTEYLRLFEEGQKPKFLIIGCCDSRVDPAIVFDCNPGDMFVVRNVANIVPPAKDRTGHHGTTSALEYGVCNLGVEHIIVLGHAHCGGIQNLVHSGGVANPNSYIDDWMSMVEPARASVMQDFPDGDETTLCRACEQRAILISLKNLLTFPWIADRVAENKLALHGWYFDITQGQLLGYHSGTQQFEVL